MLRVSREPGHPTEIRPDRCARRIAQVQRRWCLLQRSSALSTLVAAAVVIGAVLISVDRYLRGGHAARTVLLMALLVLLTWLIRRLVAPAWRGVSVNQAALLIERAHPDLHGRLVTAVQLASAQARRQHGISHDLYAVVCTQAETSAGRVEASEVLPGRHHVRRSAVAWVVLASVTALAAAYPADALIGLQRLAIPWSRMEWPRRTRIELVHADKGPVRVVRGGTLVLEGRVTGAVPSSGTLTLSGGAVGSDRAYFDVGGDGQFGVRYRPVTTDLTVTLAIGDATSPPLVVEMVLPPEIKAIELECVDPEYTAMGARRLADGNVQAVYGSTIRLHVTASKPITEATLGWDDGESTPLRPVSGDATGLDATFRVEASRSYRIHLTDALGFQNDQPVLYRIEMVDNAYPRFERATPTSDKRVTPRAILPITADVVDDYGVTAVTLCYRTAGGEPQRRMIPIKHHERRVSIAWPWMLEELLLRPGASIEYWIEARDEGEHAATGPWPVSRMRRLSIVDEAELSAQLADQLGQVLERLAQLVSLQEECADTVQRAAGSATSRPASADATAERLRTEKWRQDRIARTAAQLGDRLAVIVEDYGISRIGEAPRLQRLRETAQTLSRMAGTDMPAIVMALDQAAAGFQKSLPPPPPSPEDLP